MDKILQVWAERKKEVKVLRSIIRSIEAVTLDWEEYSEEQQEEFLKLAQENKHTKFIQAMRKAKRIELDELNLRELRQLAIRYQITNYCRVDKETLIRELQNVKKRRKYGL